jgi:hypothetical protein
VVEAGHILVHGGQGDQHGDAEGTADLALMFRTAPPAVGTPSPGANAAAEEAAVKTARPAGTSTAVVHRRALPLFWACKPI